MDAKGLQKLFLNQKGVHDLLRAGLQAGMTTELSSLVGSSFGLVASAAVQKWEGIHLFVMEDRDAAGYLYNDLLPFVDPDRLLFFPTGYKRSVQFGQEDSAGIVRRTTVLNALRHFESGYLLVCTYPEALAEKVVDRERLRQGICTISVGDRLSISFVEETLQEYRFERVDFVHEPGQYSLRGGIIDVFSFSDNQPYRIDFFGDEVESLRHFDIGTQLSVDRLDRIEVVPNLKDLELAAERVSLATFVGEAAYWFSDPTFAMGRLDDIRKKILSEQEDPKLIDSKVTSSKAFLEDTSSAPYFVLKDNLKGRSATTRVEFHTAPQPQFNKKFELLAEDICAHDDQGYKTYLLTENKAQIERLQNIFNSIGQRRVPFEGVSLTLHGGFIDHASKSCFYTDHQLFERFQRYQIRGEIDRGNQLTIQELNSLEVGDYVVHIDHGVGRFGGLTRTVENGKVHEAIKLVYRDNDVLLVNVHALHRISKYKDKDSEPPRIHKLGTGAWQKVKQQAKNAVKEIARELIQLYARRKATPGFAFSPDSYLQHELEASFLYEDTPDQQLATRMVKEDMESPAPMDRLVCGDVGFGKTEIAVRAAFKAVTDSKQVAVLVPTTILALQHYRTFSGRLSEFPVRVEHLSRSKSAAETRHVLKELSEGKIDILIGTHKILGKDIHFKDLGLLIIDEEQKFGVAAKERLRQTKANVDTLTLTATPIPRTLQFSLMGSRDFSVISTPPPNRQPIATESHLFDPEIIREAIDFELDRGGQVYFVHNRLSDIGRIENLVRELCPRARTVVGHGQLPPKELERLMMDFIYGEYDVLISTTIVESGVDVPNANTMIINNAHNFGLSDLHQLRGRVGRSNRKAFCYLFTPPEEHLQSDARRRMRAIEEFSDLGAGFNIAMQDLDIRGAGNLLGGEQSGFISDIGFETYQKILNEAMAELHEEEVTEALAKENKSSLGGAPAPTPSVATMAGDEPSALGSAAEKGGAASPQTPPTAAGATLPRPTAPGSTAVQEAGGGSAGASPSPLPGMVGGRGGRPVYLTDCYIETDREAFIPDEYVGSSSEKLRLYRALDNITDEERLARFESELEDRFGAIPAPTQELFQIVRLRWACIALGFEKAIVKNGILILQFIQNQKSPYFQSDLFGALLKVTTRAGSRFVFRQKQDKISVVVREIADLTAATSALRELLAQAEGEMK